MIYLGHVDDEQVTFALYNGIMIRCLETDFSLPILRFIRDSAILMTRRDRRLAHYHPEAREIPFTSKIPYTQRDWDYLRRAGVLVMSPQLRVHIPYDS